MEFDSGKMNELPYFIQLTDKWSKRRFALRLKSPHEFPSLAMLLDYIQHLSDDDIEGLIFDRRLSEAGRDDIEDLRTIAYNIDEKGNFTELIEAIVFKQRGRTLQLDKGLKFEHRKTDREGYADIFVAELILDRDDVPYQRNWKGYYKRKWDNNPSYKKFIENLIHAKYPERGDDVLRIAILGLSVENSAFVQERRHLTLLYPAAAGTARRRHRPFCLSLKTGGSSQDSLWRAMTRRESFHMIHCEER